MSKTAIESGLPKCPTCGTKLTRDERDKFLLYCPRGRSLWTFCEVCKRLRPLLCVTEGVCDDCR